MSASVNSSSAVPLSDADAAALYYIGLKVTQGAIGVIFETALISVYAVFFSLAVYSIFRKGVKSSGSLIMLSVVLYLFATSLTLWALSVTAWFKAARTLLLDNSDTPLLDRTALADAGGEAFGTPEEALFMFNMVVGDTVVIWRVCALYGGARWVVGIPSLMLLMSFIFNVIDLTCLTGSGWSNQSTLAGGGGVCDHAELISWAFSLFTNATCTLLIGFKAWQHRRTMRLLNVQRVSPHRLSVDKALSLLVESGFIYCLFWVVLFLPVSRYNATVYLYELFGAMGDQVSGMYPTLIIVIVNFHHTIWDIPDEKLSLSLNLSDSNGNGMNNSNIHIHGDSTSTIQWATQPWSSTNSKRRVPAERNVDVRRRSANFAVEMIERDEDLAGESVSLRSGETRPQPDAEA